MTFVILTGGIDLSVGAVIALTTMISAQLVQRNGFSPAVVIPLVLVIGAGFGALQGWLVHRFRLQPFIVTLAGMFLARGLCYLISTESISITNPVVRAGSRRHACPLAATRRSPSAPSSPSPSCSRVHGSRTRRSSAARSTPSAAVNPSAQLMGLRVGATRRRRVPAQRLLRGARGRSGHVLHALRLQPPRGGPRARCHRGRRHRRHAACEVASATCSARCSAC